MTRTVKIEARVQSTQPLTEAEKEGIRAALRGTRIKELGFSTMSTTDTGGPQAEILHDLIDMFHDHEHETHDVT